MSRLDPAWIGVFVEPSPSSAAFPPAETYIMQGPILAADGTEAQATHDLAADLTHRYRLLKQRPVVSEPGGTIHMATAREFPRSASMSSLVVRLQPRALHAPHWHPNANEWMYVASGHIRVTMFGVDKRLATAELSAGECAYIPRCCGHTVECIGDTACEVLCVTDNGAYVEASLGTWFAHAPRHVLAANLGVAPNALPIRPGADERIVLPS